MGIFNILLFNVYYHRDRNAVLKTCPKSQAAWHFFQKCTFARLCTCHVSQCTCHMSQCTCQISQFTYNVSQCTCHMWREQNTVQPRVTVAVFWCSSWESLWCRGTDICFSHWTVKLNKEETRVYLEFAVSDETVEPWTREQGWPLTWGFLDKLTYAPNVHCTLYTVHHKLYTIGKWCIKKKQGRLKLRNALNPCSEWQKVSKKY